MVTREDPLRIVGRAPIDRRNAWAVAQQSFPLGKGFGEADQWELALERKIDDWLTFDVEHGICDHCDRLRMSIVRGDECSGNPILVLYSNGLKFQGKACRRSFAFRYRQFVAWVARIKKKRDAFESRQDLLQQLQALTTGVRAEVAQTS